MTHHTKVAGTAEGPGLEDLAPEIFGLMLGCIGVVYGDIGTSPLYALRESVLAAVGPTAQAGEEVILGILSLIIWALILIVTVKYVMILLRADNNGEGGTLALMALARRALGGNEPHHHAARHDQRGAVLWRCDDYAGPVRPIGRRRIGGHHARALPATWCRSRW